MNRHGYRCRACRHGRQGCKGKAYRKHGCAGPRPVKNRSATA